MVQGVNKMAFSAKEIFKGVTAVVFLLSVMLFSAGCRSGAESAPDAVSDPDRDWNISVMVSEAGGGEDSCEGFNRSMQEFNHFFMRWFVRPVGYVYGSIFPREAIRHINMAADNLSFPGRMMSCLCQAKFTGAGVELSRFLINSTMGIAGLFDPADYYFDLFRRDENFGTAFASWGIGSGAVLTLPVWDTAYVRDHVGSVFDMAFDIKTYLPYTSFPCSISKAVDNYRPYIRLSEGSYDRYEMLKEYYILRRQMQQREWSLKYRLKLRDERIAAEKAAEKGEKIVLKAPAADAYQQSLRYAAAGPLLDESSIWTHLSLWNTDFSSRLEDRELQLSPDAEPMKYAFIPSRHDRQNSALVVILPGLGGYHMNGFTLMLAEIFNDKSDNSVLLLNNSLSWATRQAECRRLFGGYGPDDAALMKEAYLKIMQELYTEKGYKPRKTVFFGYSLGALNALQLGADPELKIDRVVAVNPPVNLVYAMKQLDECRNAARGLPKEKVIEMAVDGFGKISVMASVPSMAEYFEFDPVQAKLLIYLSFGYSLRDMLAVAWKQSEAPLPGISHPYSWGDRTQAYAEMDKNTFADYMNKYVMPQYPGMSAEDLNRASSLAALDDFLRNSGEKVVVLHNRNDFLLSDADRKYLDEVLRERIIWSPEGGHLGNVHTEDFRAKVVSAVNDFLHPGVATLPRGDVRLPAKAEKVLKKVEKE